jgi:hypothetical protein
MASARSIARTVGSRKATDGRREVKRLEPHGRMQGAINLQGSVRSKPSESGGTTRTEGVRRQAASGRRQQVLSGAGSWERTHRAENGGGAIFGQPQERQSGWAGWKVRDASADHAGRRARKDGAHRFVSPKEARRTGRLEKVPQGAGRNWTGKATRTRNYGFKVEVACGKDQRPAPSPGDGKKSMLRQRWTSPQP